MDTQDTIIVHLKTAEQFSVLKAFMQALKIKFEVAKDETYNPEFVAKIEESRRQYKNGDFISIEKRGIKNFLGLE